MLQSPNNRNSSGDKGGVGRSQLRERGGRECGGVGGGK